MNKEKSIWDTEHENASHFTRKMLKSINRDMAEMDVKSEMDLLN